MNCILNTRIFLPPLSHTIECTHQFRASPPTSPNTRFFSCISTSRNNNRSNNTATKQRQQVITALGESSNRTTTPVTTPNNSSKSSNNNNSNEKSANNNKKKNKNDNSHNFWRFKTKCAKSPNQVTCVCLRRCFTFYHSKSPLNHHLRILVSNKLKQI